MPSAKLTPFDQKNAVKYDVTAGLFNAQRLSNLELSTRSIPNIQSNTRNDMSNEVQLTLEGIETPIFFRSSYDLSLNDNVRLISNLFPCMAKSIDLPAGNNTSSKLLNNLEDIQDILTSWEPALSRVKLHQCEALTTNDRETTGVATFFSGGLDSFYTLVKHKPEITHLIFVHGFDIALTNKKLLKASSDNIKRIAERFGIEVIEVETNLGDAYKSFMKWQLAHGAALATIGHLLSNHLSKIYIPSTFTYNDLFPWGSHPILDQLWGTEKLVFKNDGGESTRINKAKLVATEDVALETLRVCYKQVDGKYNCGKCEKCIRTLLNFTAIGSGDKLKSFPNKLTPKMIRKIRMRNEGGHAFILENLNALKSNNGDQKLIKALNFAIVRSRISNFFISLRQSITGKKKQVIGDV